MTNKYYYYENTDINVLLLLFKIKISVMNVFAIVTNEIRQKVN